MANKQLEKSQWTQVNTDFVEKISTFEFQRKKIGALQALWISRTIYKWRFFDNISPTWENWIKSWSFYSARNLKDF